MKFKITLFILLLISLSCTKKDPIKSLGKNPLLGKWSWLQTCDSVSNICNYPDSNNFIMIEFTYDEYIVIQNDTGRSVNKYFSIKTTLTLTNRTTIDYCFELIVPNPTCTPFSIKGSELKIINGKLIETYKKII